MCRDNIIKSEEDSSKEKVMNENLKPVSKFRYEKLGSRSSYLYVSNRSSKSANSNSYDRFGIKPFALP